MYCLLFNELRWRGSLHSYVIKWFVFVDDIRYLYTICIVVIVEQVAKWFWIFLNYVDVDTKTFLKKLNCRPNSVDIQYVFCSLRIIFLFTHPAQLSVYLFKYLRWNITFFDVISFGLFFARSSFFFLSMSIHIFIYKRRDR